MIKKQINISEPSVGVDEWNAIFEPISNGWLTQGKLVSEFETSFSNFHKVKYSTATTSCTSALQLMLLANGIKHGDEIILPSFTWIATANAVLAVGATPVFCDIELDSYNIDINQILKNITNRTRAVIVVHLFGFCFDIKQLRTLIPNDILIFEDAACAVGSQINGEFAGSLGDGAAFSFHPRKVLTTGEGGMFTTSKLEISDTAKKIRNHGAEITDQQRHKSDRPFLLPEFKEHGFNFRMTDMQAAIGLVQLSKLDKFISQRNYFAEIYLRELDKISCLKLPYNPSHIRHNWQSFVVMIQDDIKGNLRDNLMNKLFELGISTRPGTHAIHMTEFYSNKFKLLKSEYPKSALANDLTISLPIHNNLKEEDIYYVIDCVIKSTSTI